jgi:hypothetical protein
VLTTKQNYPSVSSYNPMLLRRSARLSRSGAAHGVYSGVQRSAPRAGLRQLSSLGSPMFPQRPRPELENFEQSIENSKKAAAESAGKGGDKGVVDILADHGGKIALVVFGGIVALFYSYYLGGKDRNRIEDAIADAVYIEPYEIQELRHFNMLTCDEFRQVVAQAQKAFPSGQASYADFMCFLKQDLVFKPSTSLWQERADVHSQWGITAPPPPRRKLKLKSSYLFDRMMMGMSIARAKEAASTTADNISENASGTLTSKRLAWADEPQSLDVLLGMLSLAMVPEADARVQALFSLAGAGEASSSAESHEASGITSAAVEEGQADAVAGVVSQEVERTVSRGERICPRASLSLEIAFIVKYGGHFSRIFTVLYCWYTAESYLVA